MAARWRKPHLVRADVRRIRAPKRGMRPANGAGTARPRVLFRHPYSKWGRAVAQAEHPLHFRPATSFTLCCLFLLLFIPTAHSFPPRLLRSEGVRATRAIPVAAEQPWR